MFLLILDVNTQKGDYNYFTFHNVSINTVFATESHFCDETLHSTMFLLILIHRTTEMSAQLTLHSTMFLLIQNCNMEQ